MSDIKHTILDEIRKACPEFKAATMHEYRINCPLCGDTKSHCYLKCSDDITEPILWNCFHCNSSGRVNGWFLKQLGIRDEVCNMMENSKVNKFSQYYMKNKPIEILTGEFRPDSKQVQYIESRLGHGFSSDDYEKFKIIWDIDQVLQFISNDRIRNSMPSNNNSISFLSDDKTMIMTRSFEPEGHNWRKIKIVNSETKSFYTIKTSLDLFTTDNIVVNLAEGVFDILSVYKNFGGHIFVATLGSDYISGVEYIISKGLVGSNIELRIYMDTDQDVKFLVNSLKKYKWIFGSIKVYWNILYKDVGVLADNIRLEERRV